MQKAIHAKTNIATGIFAQMDKNGDGEIDQTELENALMIFFKSARLTDKPPMDAKIVEGEEVMPEVQQLVMLSTPPACQTKE